jgi:hypothetical protein
MLAAVGVKERVNGKHALPSVMRGRGEDHAPAVGTSAVTGVDWARVIESLRAPAPNAPDGERLLFLGAVRELAPSRKAYGLAQVGDGECDHLDDEPPTEADLRADLR